MSIPTYLNNIKHSGIFRFVFDKSEVAETPVVDALRLVVGYSDKGPFNTPVLIRNESEFKKVFGGISKKLERYGCYFHRLALQCLKTGDAILALNIKPFTSESVEGVNFNIQESIVKNIANDKILQTSDYHYGKQLITMAFGSQKNDYQEKVVNELKKRGYNGMYDNAMISAGTENMPSVVGYGKAAEIAKNTMDEHIERLTSLRTKLIDGILEKIPYTRVNGSLEDRLPGNVNFSFEFIEGEGILLMLDMLGIAASSGSACTSGSLDPSHVLMAIGLPHEIAHGSLRLSIGDFTTEEDIDYIIEKLPPVIERLRSMSPLYDAVKNERK